MKFEETTPPIERTYILELNQEELRFLRHVVYCATAGTKPYEPAIAKLFLETTEAYDE